MAAPRVAVLTREYPPEVYGGAGTHVEYLVRELRRLTDVSVHCWGAPRDEPGVISHQPWTALSEPKPEAAALQAMSINLAMAAGVKGAGIVHSHTWYANLGGHLAKLTWSIPHVLTVHSLEPLRPWKAEQLGGGYALSMFCERTAIEAADGVIAVSGAVRQDVVDCYPKVDPDRIHVIHNGIDPEIYKPEPSLETLARFGIDPSRPYAFFNGRITRQKGLPLLLAAALDLDPQFQLVIAASSPDTAEIGAEVDALAERVRTERGNLVWINRFLPRDDLIRLHSGATVFVCPSIYEPFGLVLLEAMACESAVIASRVGGIPEIVVEGETGYMVDYDVDHPQDFTTTLASRIQELLSDPARASKMGKAGRQRVLERFGWPSIASRTLELYHRLM
ncbi:MAG: glycogen synthase [Chloroflexi bacterium]|nr:MAG: glycogen synthase [Chloroflexota bacterium]TMF37083.1 MAG: glycogen synthase [Chloroflexota bacterium]